METSEIEFDKITISPLTNLGGKVKRRYATVVFRRLSDVTGSQTDAELKRELVRDVRKFVEEMKDV